MYSLHHTFQLLCSRELGGGESLGSPWQTSADRWEFGSALEEVAMYPTAYLSGPLSLVGPHLLIKHMNPSPPAPSLP